MRYMSRILLIVEDEKDMQELMKRYIEKAGLDLEIYSAYDGKEGVEMYKKLLQDGKKPDLVIMDLKLPEMDGVEATKRIKEIDKDAVIYGFTAFFDTDWANRLLKAGAKKIIPRYVGFEGFIKELREFFGK
ncbi:MAG: response regulator [Thermoplasmata archaeon]|nr:MAG: response regulator [Thermoplasmata archaeon]